jgi:hypothetical protein
MPRIKLTKSAIDAVPTPKADVVYWDVGCPGFGVKVTPKGRKVFIVLYRTGGAGSKLRKYTIGPYGRVTLHQARVAAQKKPDGRDPAADKRETKRRVVADRVEDLLETFIAQRLSHNRSGAENCTSAALPRRRGTARPPAIRRTRHAEARRQWPHNHYFAAEPIRPLPCSISLILRICGAVFSPL